MELWQKARQKMGNTTMRQDAWFAVRIIEKHERHCLVSWNGNPARAWRVSEVVKLYRKRIDKKATQP
jgi:hypothetical protein